MGEEEIGTARLEAFSDGVFAIAITLLILDIKVPEVGSTESLFPPLLKLWPAYFAYLTSFLNIGVMWINHHRLFKLIRHTNHMLLLLNTMLLLGITFVPFPTALVADYLMHAQQQQAALVYTGTYVVIAIIFNGLWFYSSYKSRLLGKGVDPEKVREVSIQYLFGPVFYAAAFVTSFYCASAGLLISFGLAVFFALPRVPLKIRRSAEPK